ncbi:zebrafish testis-expressed 38 isoform X2 [Genypterus blacodes]|uniref:zebrafish testis-expressed 38 isoform X2 n=1 Tax=Genypterus blacodes TaxID=154954 RepID=UPI003F76E4C7
MAASKLCIKKNKEDTTQWTGLFVNDLKTEGESLVFVKRMMAIAVSSITYLRGIFPEEAYRSRYLEDLCLKVLREDCNTPGACKLVKWMMGCFEALERRYLQIVFIGVYTNPDEANCIIESYQFKFKYTEVGPQMDILRTKRADDQITMEDTRKATVLLIRKLFLLMQNLDALPEKVYLSMKLYYYDDFTPAEYEPPGFKEGQCDSLFFEGVAVHLGVGEVETDFHKLRVGVSVEQRRMEKLQEGTQHRETKQDSHSNPPDQVPCQSMTDKEALPSEDESESQFKKPRRPVAKMKVAAKRQAKTRRR